MIDILGGNFFTDGNNPKEWPEIVTSQLPTRDQHGNFHERGNPEGACYTVQATIPYDCVMAIAKVKEKNEPLDCLEIGRRNGFSTRIILEALKKVGGHLDSIDTNDCDISKVLDEDMKKLYTPILGSCHTIPWEKMVDFIFIDTMHTYQDTKQELEKYWQWLRSPGILIVHKCESHWGCKKAVWEWTQNKRITMTFDNRGQGMAILVKPNYPLGLRDRAAPDDLSNKEKS